MLPFDAMCRPDSLYYMPIIWQIFTIAILAIVVVWVPFSICCYEEEGTLGKQIYTGVCWAIGSLVVFALIVVIMYIFLGDAEGFLFFCG
jgi:hypothetical protein